MAKKHKRYSFYSAESPEEVIARIEEAVPRYNAERYGKELEFTRTEGGFRLKVMRANSGAHYYEAEISSCGGTKIDGELRYEKEKDDFSKIDRFFHKAGLIVCWVILFPFYLVAACIITARLKAHGSPRTKEKTLIDFMENFALCEREKENG